MSAPHNTTAIETLLARFQDQHIIPHCRVCGRPCCMLTDVVLEFDWPHLKAVYGLKEGKKEFDQKLAQGTAPEYIREMDGTYYTHGSPCPGYDPARKQCTLYDSPLKPDNCSDFPLYLDGDTIVADSRCEAMDVQQLLTDLREALPGLQFQHGHHPDFAVLNYIGLRPKNSSANPRRRR